MITGGTDAEIKIYAALGAAAALAAATVIQVRAANDKFTFPDGFEKGVNYLTLDKPASPTQAFNEVQVLYAPKEAIAAAKDGKPMPAGTIFVIVFYNAKLGADAQSRYRTGCERPLPQGYAARVYGDAQKSRLWGAEYPPEKRNGEWEYRVFTADRQWNDRWTSSKGASVAICRRRHMTTCGPRRVEEGSLAGSVRPLPAARRPPELD